MPEPTPVITPNQSLNPDADLTRAWKIYHDQVMDLLRDRMGLAAAETIAQNTARDSVRWLEYYLKTDPPGVAQQRADAQFNTLLAETAKKNNIPLPGSATSPTGSTPGDGSVVDSEDKKNALNTYRGGITKGQETYEAVVKDPVNDPNARATFTPVTTKPVAAQGYDASQVGQAARLSAALQARTSVGATDTGDLAETAAGNGAGGLAAAARYRLQQQQAAANANAGIQQARGFERRGLRRALLLGENEQNMAAANAIEERNQADRQAAQAKIAELDSQRKSLQATLDQARAKGDQDAINDLTRKMADLDARTAEFNATATNTAKSFAAGEQNRTAEANANRDVTVQTTNNAGGLAANVAGADQDIKQKELQIKAQKALEDSAKGLLDEETRQENIKNARAGVELAKAQLAEMVRQHRTAEELAAKQQEINEWLSVITGLASVGASVATKTSDVRTKEGIKKISPADLEALGAAVQKSLSTWKYKPGQDLPEGEQSGVIADDLIKTRLGKTLVSENEDGIKQVDMGTLATLLAAASLKRKKGIA